MSETNVRWAYSKHLDKNKWLNEAKIQTKGHNIWKEIPLHAWSFQYKGIKPVINASFVLPQVAAWSGQTPHTALPCGTPRGTQNPPNLVPAYGHNPCSAPHDASPAHVWTGCWTPQSVGTHETVLTHKQAMSPHVKHLSASQVIQQRRQILIWMVFSCKIFK